MNFHLGKKIAEVAKSRGLSQAGLGEKVNTSKPGIASIYKRSGIDTDKLIQLTEALDYDFFKHIYENEPLKKHKEEELAIFKTEIDRLNHENELLKIIVQKNDQILELQFKHITELESKIDKK